MKKYTTSERLNQIMKEKNLKQIDILDLAKPYCEKYGVKIGRNDLSQYVTGKFQPSQKKLSVLGLALNVNEVWLMGYDVPPSKDALKMYEKTNGKKIPILGDIACGKPILAESNVIDFAVVSENERVDFALIAQGNSMNNARIESGDTVFIRQQPIVENGEIALVLIDNEATIKRFFDYPDKVVLTPDSKDTSYKPMIYSKKDCEIRVQGKIIFTKAIIR